MTRVRGKLGAANTVTLARVVSIPAFMVVLLTEWPTLFPNLVQLETARPWIAAAVFIVLAATDGVDGYLARTLNEVTTFGKFIDPLADKLLVTAALLALTELGILPSWIAFLIIAREFIVSGLRMVASAEGLVIAASWYGKVKTVLQISAIVGFLIKDSSVISSFSPQFAGVIQATAWLLMGGAVIMTIVSMADYFVHAREVLVGPWSMAPAPASGPPDESETVGGTDD